MRAALEIPNVVDNDIKTALDALIRTYRTRETGLYYDSRPDNTISAAIFEAMQRAIDDIRKRVAEHSGVQNIRDLDILGIFAFLQRLEIQHNNGRRLGRAFVDYLRAAFPPSQPEPESLIV